MLAAQVLYQVASHERWQVPGRQEAPQKNQGRKQNQQSGHAVNLTENRDRIQAAANSAAKKISVSEASDGGSKSG